MVKFDVSIKNAKVASSDATKINIANSIGIEKVILSKVNLEKQLAKVGNNIF